MIFLDLLENYFILKENNKDLYYEIKDNIYKYKEFINDYLGYNLIVKDDFIKLEKLPGHAEDWMGIREFTDTKEYMFFLILLMFLEDKNKEEQFILSNLTVYIEDNFKNEKIDWSIFKNRKYLINVINVALNMGIIKKTDGDEEYFSKDESGNVLYENTGLSKYVLRRFNNDICNAQSMDEIIDNETRGSVKNKVYRQLLLSPVVYDDNEDEYEYIRKYKSSIRTNFEKILGWDIHVHKNGALAVLRNIDEIYDTFPGKNSESNAVLFINKEFRNMLNQGELKPDYKDEIKIKRDEFNKVLLHVRERDGHGFVKNLRECSDELFINKITHFMEQFYMIKECDYDKNTFEGEECIDSLILMPFVFKIIGQYPSDYKGGRA